MRGLLQRRSRFAVIVILVLAAPRTARADDDPWWGKDKALHFGVSAGLASGGYAVGAAAFDARWKAIALGGGVAAAAGIAKETADLAGFGDPSWKDLAWDAIGIVTGLALAWSVDLLVRGASSEHPAFGTGRF